MNLPNKWKPEHPTPMNELYLFQRARDEAIQESREELISEWQTIKEAIPWAVVLFIVLCCSGWVFDLPK